MDIYVGVSDIHGIGVFAKNDIVRDSIIEYSDFTVYDSFYKIPDVDKKYLFHIDGIYYICDGICRNINSSINDNVFYKIENNKLVFYSNRNIKKGDELTIYYGFC